VIARKRSQVELAPGFTLADLHDGRLPPNELPISRDGYITAPWFRVWINEPTVDIVEAFIDTVTAPLGLKVHYVDCWSLHVGEGGVHCGTNVIRTPPSTPWWIDESSRAKPSQKTKGR
jgi:hypothetical protein